MKEAVERLVMSTFLISLGVTIALILYSMYAVMSGDNLNALTSIAIGCICFALSIATAKQFQA